MEDRIIRELQRRIIADAKKNYIRDGAIAPAAILFSKKDSMVVPMAFSNQEEKQESISSIKNMIRMHDITVAFMIYEAHMMVFKDYEREKYLNEDGTAKGRIGDMDGSKDVIIVVLETKDGINEMTTIEVCDGVVGPEITNAGKIGGALSNLFANPVWLN